MGKRASYPAKCQLSALRSRVPSLLSSSTWRTGNEFEWLGDISSELLGIGHFDFGHLGRCLVGNELDGVVCKGSLKLSPPKRADGVANLKIQKAVSWSEVQSSIRTLNAVGSSSTSCDWTLADLRAPSNLQQPDSQLFLTSHSRCCQQYHTQKTLHSFYEY